jgi:hypothetical protein
MKVRVAEGGTWVPEVSDVDHPHQHANDSDDLSRCNESFFGICDLADNIDIVMLMLNQ